jgi:AraC-like DNA-binding protein
MKKLTLAGLLTPKRDLAALLQQLIQSTGARIWVEDPAGTPVFGSRQQEPSQKHPVKCDHELLGYVCGEEQAGLIADWLSQWALQEEGKKKLGTEVLHLYRELNLIFSFSERLASIVGAGAIAQLALQEAGRLIRFEYGTVLFNSSPDAPPEVLAEKGTPPGASLRQWIAEGSSDIVALPAETGSKWLMATSLKVKHRLLGSILLFRNDPEEFSAAELKLLTTLALQSAAAMESSLLYEKERALALEQQREQLVIDRALRDPFFRKVAGNIEKHLGESDFNVEKLSEAVHLSPSQLQRKVLNLTDKTPLQVIRDMRLKKARKLLSETDQTIAEIAWQCGFADPSYFTRLFRKEEGHTPTQWRESHSKA